MTKKDEEQVLDEVMSRLGEFGKYQQRQFILHVIGGLTAG